MCAQRRAIHLPAMTCRFKSKTLELPSAILASPPLQVGSDDVMCKVFITDQYHVAGKRLNCTERGTC